MKYKQNIDKYQLMHLRYTKLNIHPRIIIRGKHERLFDYFTEQVIQKYSENEREIISKKIQGGSNVLRIFYNTQIKNKLARASAK